MKKLAVYSLAGFAGLALFAVFVFAILLILPPIAFVPLVAVGFLALVRFLDLYEREPISVILLMVLWGAVFATSLSVVGNITVGAIVGAIAPDVELLYGAAISAPLVEEIAKGVALVVAFYVSYRIARRFGTLEFEGVTDGIVYGAAVGIGFTLVEDMLYFWNNVSAGGIEAGAATYALRTGFLGIEQFGGHAIYTGIFGAGLGLATWSRGWVGKVGWPALGLALAMFLHAVNNGLISFALVSRYGFENTVLAFSDPQRLAPDLLTQMDSTALFTLALLRVFGFLYIILFFVAIALWLRHQRQVIRFELSEEANNAFITPEEADIMPRFFRRSRWYWQLLKAGQIEQWKLVRRVHNELADLAFLKWRLRKTGGDWNQVEVRRQRIAALRSQKVVESPTVGQPA